MTYQHINIRVTEYIGTGVLVIVSLLLLIFGFNLIKNFYVCDNRTCLSFTNAGYGVQSDKDTARNLLDTFGQNGVWPFPFVGAIVITFLTLWLLTLICQRPLVNACNILMIFLISFISIYGLFQFYTHHYLKPLSLYLIQVLDE